MADEFARHRAILENCAATMLAACTDSYLSAIARAVDAIVRSFSSGNKLLVFGNGGSSADAEHICAELVGRFRTERPGLPAISLSSNHAVITSWANDYSFDTVFQRQVEALGKPGDVAWGISTSGNSSNVIRGLKAAQGAGMKTIGMTGQTGGQVVSCCDVAIRAPSADTPRIQEVHLATYHAICEAVEARLTMNAGPAIDGARHMAGAHGEGPAAAGKTQCRNERGQNVRNP